MGKFIRLVPAGKRPVVVNTDYIVRVHESGTEGRATVCLDVAALPSWDNDACEVEELCEWLQAQLLEETEDS